MMTTRELTSLGQPWQEKKTQESRLRCPGNARWFFAHYPKDWELVYFETKTGKSTKKIARFLPLLRTVKELAGVNGCRGSGGYVDSSLMRANMQESGWTILQPRDHDYLRIYPALTGSYHSSRFVELEELAGDLIETFDHEQFNLWRLSLMREGYISPPHPHILKKIILDQSRNMNRKARFQHIPEEATKLKDMAQKKRDMESAIADLKKSGAQSYEF